MINVQYNIMSAKMVETNRVVRTHKARPHTGDLIRIEVDGEIVAYEMIKCVFVEPNDKDIDLIVYCKFFEGC